MYLSNHDSLKNDHPLKLGSKSAAVKFGIETMKRLFPNEENNSLPQVSSENENENLSLQERLEVSVGSINPKSLLLLEHCSSNFKKEFDYYDRHKVRSPLLNKLYDALCSAQPTSTQSERNFSLAAGLCTKKRARMSSEKLNACCFLKSYFLNFKYV